MLHPWDDRVSKTTDKLKYTELVIAIAYQLILQFFWPQPKKDRFGEWQRHITCFFHDDCSCCCSWIRAYLSIQLPARAASPRCCLPRSQQFVLNNYGPSSSRARYDGGLHLVSLLVPSPVDALCSLPLLGDTTMQHIHGLGSVGW